MAQWLAPTDDDDEDQGSHRGDTAAASRAVLRTWDPVHHHRLPPEVWVVGPDENPRLPAWAEAALGARGLVPRRVTLRHPDRRRRALAGAVAYGDAAAVLLPGLDRAAAWAAVGRPFGVDLCTFALHYNHAVRGGGAFVVGLRGVVVRVLPRRAPPRPDVAAALTSVRAGGGGVWS